MINPNGPVPEGMLDKIWWCILNIKKIRGTSITAVPPSPPGLVESISFEDSGNNIAAQSYSIILNAFFGCTVNEIVIVAGAGTCTAALQINGVNITGCGAISVSTVNAIANATGNNTIVAGNILTLVITSPSGLNGLQACIKLTRT